MKLSTKSRYGLRAAVEIAKTYGSVPAKRKNIAAAQDISDSYLENILIVPLYFAKERPVVNKDGMLIMVDDDRMPIGPDDKIEMKKVRFRTLGCYPLTGAVESNATTLPEIIQEMLLTTTSERQGRLIDHDQSGSMEQKKREGYF